MASMECELLETALCAQEAGGFGATFVYGTISGPCSLGSIGFGGRLTAGGFSPHAETTAVFRKSVLSGDNLNVGQVFQITDARGDERDLKIARDGIRDGIYFWELTLQDLNQNA